MEIIIWKTESSTKETDMRYYTIKRLILIACRTCL